MYFNALMEKIGILHDYMPHTILKYEKEIKENSKSDRRQILGKETFILSFKEASPNLKNSIEFLQHYVMALQHPVLKDKVPYERSVCHTKLLIDNSTLPNTYINRIGENVVIIIRGYIKIKSNEFQDSSTMNSGDICRINSRIPMNYYYSDDFLAISISYVDFDLVHYLMPFDFYGIMPRRKDEYPDYDPLTDNVNGNEDNGY